MCNNQETSGTGQSKALALSRLAYKIPPHRTEQVDLIVILGDETTAVAGSLLIEAHEGNAYDKIVLYGKNIELSSVTLNSETVNIPDVHVEEDDEEMLVIPLKAKTTGVNTVRTEGLIHPAANLSLEGLYKSKELLTTQCETTGFRKILYSQDRPDVLAKYRVTIIGDKAKYPTMLSNGNVVESGKIDLATAKTHFHDHALVDKALEGYDVTNLEFCTFEDPFYKPSYLFAIIAGHLSFLESVYTPGEGRPVPAEIRSSVPETVTLRVYSDKRYISELDYAMESLHKAIIYDEKRFHRYMDLKEYSIVAIEDFAAGAMENKGLNTFNVSMILVSKDTTADKRAEIVLDCVGHEFFHNWSGNRVTCRDWFQLTLKEGLTSFREAQFSRSEQGFAARLEQILHVKSLQFAEDASALSHPIRPEDVVSIENFYTTTIYDKGAEVIGMIHTILGEELFREGLTFYFDHFDGKAVSCEDFLWAFKETLRRRAEQTGELLPPLDEQFDLWYFANGTPEVTVVSRKYCPDAKSYSITLRQQMPEHAKIKKPLHIPVRFGLIGRTSLTDVIPAKTLHLRETEQTFVFTNIGEEVVPSVLREFSAPIKLASFLSEEELMFLLGHDSDPYISYECAQITYRNEIQRLYNERMSLPEAQRLNTSRGEQTISKPITDTYSYLIEGALRQVRNGEHDKLSDVAISVGMPSVMPMLPYFADEYPSGYDPEVLVAAERSLSAALAIEFAPKFQEIYDLLTTEVLANEWNMSVTSVGRRQLRNNCFLYLIKGMDDRAKKDELITKQYETATCLSDRIAAISATEERSLPIWKDFESRAQGHINLTTTFFGSHFRTFAEPAYKMDALDIVAKHPSFSIIQANHFSSLLGIPASSLLLHTKRGKYYETVWNYICEHDKASPITAARLAIHLRSTAKVTAPYKAEMKRVLLSKQGTYSKNLTEVVDSLLSSLS